MTAEELAQLFHETYERLAPEHGYETRKESSKPWADVPAQNKRLMIAVCQEVMLHLGISVEWGVKVQDDVFSCGHGHKGQILARDITILQTTMSKTTMRRVIGGEWEEAL